MDIAVKKFGGSSLENIDRIMCIAKHISDTSKTDDKIIIVVSAMSKTTDELFSLAYSICDDPLQRELDMLLTAGERISMSLLSLALHKYGIKAISFTGSQSGIITDDNHGNAQIMKVNAYRISEELEKGKVVIVAGFQGVSMKKEVTTLGRGGSDTSAIAISGFMQSKRCEIYTDVEGVYTCDPRHVKEASIISCLDYRLMLHMARTGSRVIHPRAVEFAMKYSIEVEIKSSFSFNKRGTIIKKVDNMEELKSITSISFRESLFYFRFSCSQDDVSKKIEHIYEKAAEVLFINGDIHVFAEDCFKNYFLTFLNKNTAGDVGMKENICSITITGYNLYEDSSILNLCLKKVHEYKGKILNINRNCLGFTLFLDNLPAFKDFVTVLHKAIFTKA